MIEAEGPSLKMALVYVHGGGREGGVICTLYSI